MYESLFANVYSRTHTFPHGFLCYDYRFFFSWKHFFPLFSLFHLLFVVLCWSSAWAASWQWILIDLKYQWMGITVQFMTGQPEKPEPMQDSILNTMCSTSIPLPTIFLYKQLLFIASASIFYVLQIAHFPYLHSCVIFMCCILYLKMTYHK